MNSSVASRIGGLIAALSLVGCGGNDEATAPTAVDPENVSPPSLATAPPLRDATGARKDVTLEGCPVTGKQATASGKLSNPSRTARDYVVTVSWINDRSDVMARAVSVERAVKPGERRAWRATTAAGKATNDNCTVFAQRGAVLDNG